MSEIVSYIKPQTSTSRRGRSRTVKPKGKKASKRAQSVANARGRSTYRSFKSTIPLDMRNALPAAYSIGQKTVRPKVQSNGTSCTIVHRELVLKVAMTVNYSVQQLSCNPGLPQTFPWLSSIAANWETYRFKRLRFCYYTRVGSATGGSVILSPDYNASDLTPASEYIASTYIDTAEDVSWKDICCTLRTEGMHALGPKKFVRTTNLSPNLDVKTYDVATLNVATVDGVAGPAGNLWAEYEIELSNPQLNPKGDGAAYQHYFSAAGVITANLLLGFVDKSLATYATFTAPNVLTFTSAGRFEVLFFISSATSATEAGATNVIGGTGGVRQDYIVIGNGTTTFEDDMVIDALVGTTVTYPITVVGAAASDLVIIPLGIRTPY